MAGDDRINVRVGAELRATIAQLGEISEATRALLLLGLAAAGIAVADRDVRRALAGDLDARVLAALAQIGELSYKRQTDVVQLSDAGPAAPRGVMPTDAAASPEDDEDDPYANMAYEV